MNGNEKRILLAGAAGAIGRRLTPLLCAAGYRVWGTTRSPAKARQLEEAGAEPVIVDVFDAPALAGAARSIGPAIVIHQLTDLPARLDPAAMAAAMAANARLRETGTANLVAAALAAGARRLIAQSIAWIYAPGDQPYGEDQPLDLAATGIRGISVAGVAALERLTLRSPPLLGIVLRYGQLYGPGTWNANPAGSAPLHVDAAAQAAVLAIERGQAGIYNIAEDTGLVSIAKARAELGFHPAFRI